MKYRSWTIHAIIECAECKWSSQDFMTAQKEAAKHARKTGHFVSGEIGKCVEYGEKKNG